MKFDPIISVPELVAQLGKTDLVLVDVRFNLTNTEWGREAYMQGHIPGAFYAHLDDDLSAPIIPGVTGRHPWPSVNAIEALLSQFGVSHDSHVVIYDQSHGGIAARLWAICQYVGLSHVQVLNGGWKHWIEAEAPQEKQVPTQVDSEFKAREASFGIVEVDALGSANCLVDARANIRYKGEEEPIDPVAGHIPGAINYPFLENLNEDMSWKSKGQLAKRFASIGDQEIVMYCGSGVTACHNMIALERAGFSLPKLYPGSWSAYITDPNREIAIN